MRGSDDDVGEGKEGNGESLKGGRMSMPPRLDTLQALVGERVQALSPVGRLMLL